jgi:hypothetical protein
MKKGEMSYKDTYHFNENYQNNLEEMPSIYKEPTINTTIKENPYRSNVEIEKDELVLKPDMSAMFKAKGKKHSQGGTDVFLEPDSFIFSNDKTLALDEKDHDLFELKKGGKVTNPYKNTPAKVVERNVDLEHYNSLMAILNDPKKDELSKKSAMLMLQKYTNTLGNIAYIQEGKKDFPQGVPEFAEGTAPVYDTNLKNEIMEQKQYAKYGGKINNPYLPKAQMGAITTNYDPNIPLTRPVYSNPLFPSFMSSYNPDNHFIPHPGDKYNTFQNNYGISNASKYNAAQIANLAEARGYTGPMDNLSLQRWILGDPERRKVVDSLHNKYGQPTAGHEDDGIWGIRWDDALEQIPVINTKPSAPVPTKNPYTPTPTPNDVTGNAQNGIPINWEFTPWQKKSQLYNAYKWASVDREMPYRSHVKSTLEDPYLVNPEQTIADAKGLANQQITALNTLNPILRNAQAAGAYGQLLNQVPGIRTQYDNQNQQIMQQVRGINNQNINRDLYTNNQFDQQYWRDAATGRTNFRNMRSYLGDQWMNNVMRDVETNQALAYNLATLGPKPAYSFDWKTGNFLRNDKNILDVQSGTSGDTWDSMVSQIQNLRNSGLSDSVIAALIKTKAFSQMAPYMGNAPTWGQLMGKQKKGGKVNPYRY